LSSDLTLGEPRPLTRSCPDEAWYAPFEPRETSRKLSEALRIEQWVQERQGSLPGLCPRLIDESHNGSPRRRGPASSTDLLSLLIQDHERAGVRIRSGCNVGTRRVLPAVTPLPACHAGRANFTLLPPPPLPAQPDSLLIEPSVLRVSDVPPTPTTLGSDEGYSS